MSNKKVIRKTFKTGEFTQVHHSILNDTRLTGEAFRVLVSMLSDKDSFKICQTTLQRRLGIGKKALRNAFKCLEELGYLRRSELPRGHFYTISEYGNLNKEKTEKQNTSGFTFDQVADFMNSIGDIIDYDKNNSEKLVSIIMKYDMGDNQYQLHQIKQEVQKQIISPTINNYIKHFIDSIDKLNQYYPKSKIKKEFKKYINSRLEAGDGLSEEFYKKHKNKLTHIKQKNYNFKTDHETQMVDNSENWD